MEKWKVWGEIEEKERENGEKIEGKMEENVVEIDRNFWLSGGTIVNKFFWQIV